VGAELDGEALSLLVHLGSIPHLWSQIWVVTQMAGLSLRDRGEELGHPEGARSRAEEVLASG